MDVTLLDGLEDVPWDEFFRDEDHAMDLVLNNIVEDLEDEIEESFEDLDELEDELDSLEDQIEEIETEQELDKLEDEIEELEDEIGELEDEIEEDIDQLISITDQVKQPETRVVNNNESNSKTFKKGPLWQYRTNKKDDNKFN